MSAKIITSIIVTAVYTSAIWSLFVFPHSPDTNWQVFPIIIIGTTSVICGIFFICYLVDTWDYN